MSGRDRDYLHDGFSHDATDAREILGFFRNIKTYWPEEKEEIPRLIDEFLYSKEPSALSLKR